MSHRPKAWPGPVWWLAVLFTLLIVTASGIVDAGRLTGQEPPPAPQPQATPPVGTFYSPTQPVNAVRPTGYVVGWGTLALINAGLAQGKNRRGADWFLASLLLGPLATLLLVISPSMPVPGGPARQ